MKAMLWARVKLAVGLLVATAVLSGGAGVGLQRIFAQEAASPVAGGRVLVVDQAHPRASDNNSGTPEAPWKTITQAARIARAGDTVLVLEGEYPELVAPAASGQEGRWITFRGVPRQRAVVRGFELNTDYLRVEGFKIATLGQSLKMAVSVKGKHVEITDNLFEGLRQFSVFGWRGSSHVRLACNHFHHLQFGPVISGEHWTVERNEVSRLRMSGELGDCDYTRFFGSQHVIRHNYFHGEKGDTYVYGQGLQETGKAHVDCFQTYGGLGDAEAHHVLIEGNVGFKFGQGLMARTDKPGPLSHFTLTGNILASGVSHGMLIMGVPDCAASNNTVVTGMQGVAITASSGNGEIKNNISVGCSLAYMCPPGGKADYNLSFRSKHPKPAGEHDLVDKDPMFADPEKCNFRLKKGSPAIDAGENGAEIGALEYPNVYYVDPCHPGADDEGFGYPGWPYKTVARALSVAEPGETVVMCGGIYRELITPKAGVTIRVMKDEKTIVSGADEITGWKRTGEKFSAPLAAKPVKILRDGQGFTGFSYDERAREISVQGFDPRLGLMETVVRRAGARVEGVEAVNALE